MFFVLHNVPPIFCPTFGVHFKAGVFEEKAGVFWKGNDVEYRVLINK